MKHLTEAEYKEKLKVLKEKNVQKKYRKNLRKEKFKYAPKLKIETNKLFAIYLFILLNAIVIYAMVAMWQFADLSYLGVMITDIAAQVLVFAIYCMKAYKAKKSEEEMKFKREQSKGNLSDILSAASDYYEKERQSEENAYTGEADYADETDNYTDSGQI